jgi:HEAT repeat protein
VLFLLLPAVLLPCACEVTAEKIEFWKGSERGPKKLAAAVANGKLERDLRVRAGLALVEIGLGADLEKALRELPASARAPVLAGLIQPLARSAAGEGGQVGRKQWEAKDALFLVRPLADPAMRSEIDGQLAAWFAADLAGRADQGSFTAEVVLRAIGPAAAPALLGLLARPDPVRLQAAELVGKIASPEIRERAASELLRQGRVERPLRPTTIAALGVVGGEQASTFLADIAQSGSEAERLNALKALLLGKSLQGVRAAVRLVRDRSAPPLVRDEAFTLLERSGAEEARRTLLDLLRADDARLRWRAVEGLLASEKAGGAVAVLEGLPVARSYPADDFHDLLCADLRKLGKSVLPALRSELASKSWVARLAAVEVLAEIGDVSDVGRLHPLVGDKTRLRGWPGGVTLGDRAQIAIERLGRTR